MISSSSAEAQNGRDVDEAGERGEREIRGLKRSGAKPARGMSEGSPSPMSSCTGGGQEFHADGSRVRGRGERTGSRCRNSGRAVPLGDSTPETRSSANCMLERGDAPAAEPKEAGRCSTSATSAASDSLHEGDSIGYSSARGRMLSAKSAWSDECQGLCPVGGVAATTAAPIILASSSASEPKAFLLSEKLRCARRRRMITQSITPDRQRDTADMLPTAAVATLGCDASSQFVRPILGCCHGGHRVHMP